MEGTRRRHRPRRSGGRSPGGASRSTGSPRSCMRSRPPAVIQSRLRHPASGTGSGMSTPPPPSDPGTPEAGFHSDGRRPAAGSMSLLQQLMDRPLDPSYAAAAARREAEGLPPSTSLRGPLAPGRRDRHRVPLRRRRLRAAAGRDDRVAGEGAAHRADRGAPGSRRRAGRRGQQARRADPGRPVGRAGQPGVPAVRPSCDKLRLLTGEVAVTGPGLVLTVDDAPDVRAKAASGDPRDAGGFPQGRVTSFDLQILCNGLWQAGAEAMSINGQRLTSRSLDPVRGRRDPRRLPPAQPALRHHRARGRTRAADRVRELGVRRIPEVAQ